MSIRFLRNAGSSAQPYKKIKLHNKILGETMTSRLARMCVLLCTLPAANALAGTIPPNQDVATTLASPPTLIDVPPLKAAAQRLDQHGIRIDLNYVDDFIANPGSGIIENQTGNLGLFGINADFNLEKIIGLKGATIHEATTVYGLRSNSHMLTNQGSMLGTINYLKYHSPVVLNMLTYEQKIGRLDFEVGRSNVLRYFWRQNCDNPFNCEPALMAGDTPLMPLRYASWSGLARYQVTRAWYLQAGGFEDNAYNLNTNGLHFSTNHSTGTLGVGEFGYTTTFKTAAFPAHYEFGLWGDTTPHTNPYLSALGRPVQIYTKDPKASEPDPIGMFAEGRQVVWVGARQHAVGAQPKNIALTWGLFAPLNGGQNFDLEAWLGGIFTGVIPGRPYDHFGFRVHYLQLGSDFAHSETVARILAGGNADPQPRNEYSFEVSYDIHLAPGVMLAPTAQYLINQDTYYFPKTRIAPRNGFVVSAFLVISLDHMLGLPAPRL
ncbi:carbohydrate porin [Acidocella aminolytica]|nr:carbohydrate porin [Acidocella aminolytica]